MSDYRAGEAIKRVMARAGHQSGATALARRIADLAVGPRLLFLMYHRIADRPDRFHPALSTQAFCDQIAYIATRYPCLTAEEVCDYLVGRRRLTRTSVAVTFDDGYRDTGTIAQPVLARHGVPAMVFLATCAIGTGRALWPDRLGAAFRETTRQMLELDGRQGLPPWLPLRTEEERISALKIVGAYAKTIPQVGLDAFVQEIQERLGVEERSYDGMLSWEEVVAVDRRGIAVGGHTINHQTLSRLPLERAEEEIVRSKEEIERHLGHPIRLFCYPNGTFSDITPAVKRIVERAGFVGAVSAEEGGNDHHGDPFALLRVPAYQRHVPTFAVQLVRSQLTAPVAQRLPTGFRVEPVTTTERWDALEAAWRELEVATYAPSLFLTWDWLRSWWEVFGEGKRLWVLAVWHPDGRLIGVAPWYLRIERVGGLVPCRMIRWIGDGESVAPEYLDLLARPEEAEDVAQAVGQYLVAQRRSWDLARWRRVRPESAAMRRLQVIVRGAGCTVEPVAEPLPCPYVELPTTWEEYLGRLSPNMRHNIQRRRKKLAKEFPDAAFSVGAPAGDVRQALAIMADLHLKRKATQGIASPFGRASYRQFHERLAERLARRGQVYFAFLRVGGAIAAAQYGFRDGETLYAYQIAFDPAHGKSGVAQILMSHILETEIQRGTRCVDFLRGREPYKFDWTDTERSLVEVVSANRSLRGRLAVLYRWCKGRIGGQGTGDKGQEVEGRRQEAGGREQRTERCAVRAERPSSLAPRPSNQLPTAMVLGMSPNGLAIVRDLGRHGVPVVAFDSVPGLPIFAEGSAPRVVTGQSRKLPRGAPPALASRYCRPVILPPLAEQPQAWVAALLDAAKGQTARGVVYPAGDQYALFLSQHRQVLEPHYHLVIPRDEIVQSLPDKERLYEASRRVGVATAFTLFPKCEADLAALNGHVRYPCIVKPVRSYLWAGCSANPYKTQKLVMIHSLDQLLPVFRTVQALGLEVMIQEFIPGAVEDLYGVVAYFNWRGEPQCHYVARKVRQVPADFGVASVIQTVDDPSCAEFGLTFLKGIGYQGIGHVEIKKDARDGSWKFIEANTRPILYGALGSAAGLNMPYLAYRELIGAPLPAPKGYRAGVRWVDFESDYQTYRIYRRAGRLTRASWLWSLVNGPNVGAYFAWDDPRPWWIATRRFLWRWRHVYRKAGTGDRGQGTGKTLEEQLTA